MDLKKFILYHKQHDSINSIVDGFEKSSFIDSSNEIPILVKQILSSPKLMGDLEKQKHINQLQSGGVASTKTEKPETQKKQSFCTEFNQMMLNILGLLGFDFSKYLYFLFGMKRILIREIDYIKQSKTYEEILTHMNYIRNIFSLGETSSTLPTDETPIDIDDEFFTTYYDESEYNTIFGRSNDSNSVDYNSLEVKSKKNILFDYLVKSIQRLVKIENILSFEEDKAEWVDLLENIIQHLIIHSYNIDTIDDLILNLGPYNVAYDKSFIKLYDILYDESFAQVPQEFRATYLPHILFIERELGLDIKCMKYLTEFNKYFHKTFDETLKSVMEVCEVDDIMKINISDAFYERLSNIALNLYVQLCKKIANNQQVYTYVGRSTRIQFSQVLSAMMDCAPRNCLFTKTQFETIYFILLSRKVMIESVKIVCNLS